MTTKANQILEKYKIDSEFLEEAVRSLNLAKAMNECLWVGDANHITVYVNPAFEKLSEYSLEESIGKDCTFFFEEKSKRIIEKHHTLRNRGLSSQYEGTMISKSGKKIPLLISGAPTDSGGTIGVFTNLTKLKSLAAQEQFLKEVIKNCSEAIVLLDKKKKIKLWNAGAKKIFGYKESEILNKNIDKIIPDEQKAYSKQVLKEVEDKRYIKNFETQRLTKDGKLIDVSASVTKVTDENEKLIGYLVIYYDITAQKKTSNELQKRFEAIQDAYKELGLQKRQVDYLHQIALAAASKNDLAELERLIVSAISMLIQCDGAILRLYDPTDDILKLKSYFGVDPNWSNKSKIDYKNSIAEESINRKRPLIIDNIASCPKHQGLQLVKSHKFSTLIIIPLFTSKKIIGSLSIYAIDPAKFRLIETDFLEKISTQCSLALGLKLN